MTKTNKRTAQAAYGCAFAILSLTLIAAPAWAREDDEELWVKGAVSVKLNGDTKLDLDAEGKFGNDVGGLYEIELSSLVTHEVAEGITIGAGYVRSLDYDRGTLTRTENRFRTHLGVASAVGPVKLSGRVRLEYRLRSDGNDAGFRLRPQIKATLPLARAFSLIASHESFFPLNNTDWGQRAGYQRMRNFAGVVWKVSDTVSIETGCMNEYNFGRDRNPDAMSNALSLSATLSL